MKTYQCQVGLIEFLFSLVYVPLFDATIIPILKYNAIFQIAFCLRVPWDFFPTSSEELYKYDKYLFFLLSALLVDFQHNI